MITKKIIVREATINDVAMIASAVAMAIGDKEALRNYCGENYLSVLEDIAHVDNTQYSWRRALVAEVDGKVAGAVVGYDGALLESLREGSFRIISAHVGRVPTIADETEAGEFYLDSVGVLPEFRDMGIGRALVAAMRDKAFSEGHERVGLIVDYDNPRAEALYASLGFKRVGEKIFFGHRMKHLQVNKI